MRWVRFLSPDIVFADTKNTREYGMAKMYARDASRWQGAVEDVRTFVMDPRYEFRVREIMAFVKTGEVPAVARKAA
jgi:hypothetical protein